MKKKLYMAGLAGALLLSPGGMFASQPKTQKEVAAKIAKDYREWGTSWDSVADVMTEIREKLRKTADRVFAPVSTLKELQKAWILSMWDLQARINYFRKQFTSLPAAKLMKHSGKYVNKLYNKKKKIIEDGPKPVGLPTPPWGQK